MINKIKAYIDAHEQEMLQDAMALIAINSERTEAKPGMPFGEGVAQSLDAALKMGADMGFKTENFDEFNCKIKHKKRFYETNHIIELCGILMIPLISGLQPVLDYDLKYRLGSSRGCEINLSNDGEIVGIIKQPYISENVLERLSSDILLDKISEFDQYLY